MNLKSLENYLKNKSNEVKQQTLNNVRKYYDSLKSNPFNIYGSKELLEKQEKKVIDLITKLMRN